MYIYSEAKRCDLNFHDGDINFFIFFNVSGLKMSAIFIYSFIKILLASHSIE